MMRQEDNENQAIDRRALSFGFILLLGTLIYMIYQMVLCVF